jgi:hypothetical protein
MSRRLRRGGEATFLPPGSVPNVKFPDRNLVKRPDGPPPEPGQLDKKADEVDDFTRAMDLVEDIADRQNANWRKKDDRQVTITYDKNEATKVRDYLKPMIEEHKRNNPGYKQIAKTALAEGTKQATAAFAEGRKQATAAAAAAAAKLKDTAFGFLSKKTTSISPQSGGGFHERAIEMLDSLAGTGTYSKAAVDINAYTATITIVLEETDEYRALAAQTAKVIRDRLYLFTTQNPPACSEAGFDTGFPVDQLSMREILALMVLISKRGYMELHYQVDMIRLLKAVKEEGSDVPPKLGPSCDPDIAYEHVQALETLFPEIGESRSPQEKAAYAAQSAQRRAARRETAASSGDNGRNRFNEADTVLSLFRQGGRHTRTKRSKSKRHTRRR